MEMSCKESEELTNTGVSNPTAHKSPPCPIQLLRNPIKSIPRPSLQHASLLIKIRMLNLRH
jgi:hypothetical protein